MANNDNPQDEKEKLREIALYNLSDKALKGTVAPYLVENSQLEGENDKTAMDMLYQVSLLQNGFPSGVLDSFTPEELNALLKSRQEGRRYTGVISELTIMRKALGIYNIALGNAKVSDLLALTGNKDIELSDEYSGKYMSELSNGDRAEIEKYFKGSFVDSEVSKARALMAASKVGGLVKKVKKPDEQPDLPTPDEE